MSATVEDLERDLKSLYIGRMNLYAFHKKYLSPENTSVLFDFTYRHRLDITVDYSTLRTQFNIAGRNVSAMDQGVKYMIDYIGFLRKIVNLCIDRGISHFTVLNKEELELHVLYNELEYEQVIGPTTAYAIIFVNLMIVENHLVDTRNTNKPVNRNAYMDEPNDYGNLDDDFDPLS